jgi:hypothetical protein
MIQPQKIIYSAAIIICFLAAGFYMVDHKIRNFDAKGLITGLLLKHADNAKIEIGKTDYSLGSYVRLYVNNITMQQNESLVLSAEKIIFKIPVSAIFLGNGTVQILIENPVLSPGSIKFSNNNDNKYDLEVPNFLLKSKIDIRLDNLKVDNFLENKLNFNKILLKNVNFKKSMAYELVTTLRSPHEHIAHIESQMIGEVDLSKMIQGEQLKTKLVSEVHIKFNDEKVNLPRFKLDIDIALNTINYISFDGKINGDTHLEGEFKGFYNKNKIVCDHIQLNIKDISTKSFTSMVDVKDFDLNISHLNIVGDTSFEIENNAISKNLVISIKKPIAFSLENIPMSFIGDVKINDRFWDSSLVFNLFDGSVNAKILSNVNSSGDFLDLKGELLFSNLEVDEKTLRQILWRNDDRVVTVVDYDSPQILFPNMSLSVSGQNIQINKNKFDFKALFLFDAGKYALDNLEINSTDSLLLKGNFHSEKNNKYTLDLNLMKFPLGLARFIFPVDPVNLGGSVTGKLFLNKQEPHFTYKFDGVVDQFYLGFFDFSLPIKNFLSQVEKDDLSSSLTKINTIKWMQLNISQDESKLSVKKSTIKTDIFDLINLNANVELNGKSWISGSLVLKETIPFRYEGNGKRLNPNVEYTKFRLKQR